MEYEDLCTAIGLVEKQMVKLGTTVEMHMSQQERINQHFEDLADKLFDKTDENNASIRETKGTLSALRFIGGFVAIVVFIVSVYGLFK